MANEFNKLSHASKSKPRKNFSEPFFHLQFGYPRKHLIPCVPLKFSQMFFLSFFLFHSKRQNAMIPTFSNTDNVVTGT